MYRMIKMQTTSFTEMRRKAKKYFDAVEQGETVLITRRGRVIARIVPADDTTRPSWKKETLRLKINGVELSAYIQEDRREKRE